ncbi:winged helix-turn-helix transcriptional regulator [Actinomycetospora corticicola]|uniref:DNA-binding HxlR family transcriptional regulator n=1 Tax=Actinomycetospora corticicola TaxID=663602 RepID=A0A7Y9DTM0_9PSEU|nr:winged helix-turn-helix transcriptional regulator [Actinomycetospora corticicola]NYD35179.1 DNA-binding HxlR family transcriptional regulator [Actinomycetospora corticicola]
MAPRRDYFDGCAAAHGLDLVGERWALLVVRELMLGPKRFTDLRTGLPHASPNVLSQRLRELEDAGVLRRRRLPPPAASMVYELTDWGYELEPVLQTLGRWAARSLPQAESIGVDSLVMSMRTMFAPERAGASGATGKDADGVEQVVQFLFADQPFVATLRGGDFTIVRGEASAPDATVSGAPEAWAAVLYAGHPVASAVADGMLAISGDASAVERLLDLFPMPEPLAPVG